MGQIAITLGGRFALFMRTDRAETWLGQTCQLQKFFAKKLGIGAVPQGSILCDLPCAPELQKIIVHRNHIFFRGRINHSIDLMDLVIPY